MKGLDPEKPKSFFTGFKKAKKLEQMFCTEQKQIFVAHYA